MKKSILRQGSGSRGRIDRERTDAMAVEMLTFLAHDPERLTRFFELTGMTVASLREVAGTSAFNASLVSHICSDEEALRAFATAYGHQPEEVDAVRIRLG